MWCFSGCVLFVVLSLLSYFEIMNSDSPVNHYEMDELEECLSMFETENLNYSNLSLSCDCESLMVLNSSEFEYVDENTVLTNGLTLEVQLNTSQDLPVVCANSSLPIVFEIIVYISNSLSMIGCCLVIITFFLFQELRTLPAKIVVNIALTTLIANVLLISSIREARENSDFCVAMGIFTHFSVLVQSLWMTIMCGEICYSFYRASQLIPVRVEGTRCKLLVYVFVAWTAPLVVVIPSIVVDYSTPALVQYGGEGMGACWVGHLCSEIVVVYIPLGVSLLLQVILITIGVFFLVKSSKSRNSDRSRKYIRIVLAMFVTTNMVWIFGMFFLVPNSTWLPVF